MMVDDEKETVAYMRIIGWGLIILSGFTIYISPILSLVGGISTILIIIGFVFVLSSKGIVMEASGVELHENNKLRLASEAKINAARSKLFISQDALFKAQTQVYEDKVEVVRLETEHKFLLEALSKRV